MGEHPNAKILNSTIETDIQKNIENFKTVLNSPLNVDVIFREFTCAGFMICVVYTEGMVNEDKISEFIIHACKEHSEVGEIAPDQRTELLIHEYLEIGQVKHENRVRELVSCILNGMTVILIDGVDDALLMETRGFPHRPVNKPLTEAVVIGPQEGFVENLRTNITLVRRYLQSTELITEMMSVGTAIPTRIAIMYMKGVTDEKILNEVRRRLKLIKSTSVMGIGSIQQHIEDSPNFIIPQMLQTERPDRTASCLLDGQVVLLAENSPFALIAPVTLYHLLHAPDDSFMRWQYGALIRTIRCLGIIISMLLPGIYIAVTIHHMHLLPLPLLLSIAQSRAAVPFPILAEILIMDLSFYLINEAGTRIPSQVGSTLGILGAIVLGQAAVAASVISPILIIIVAITGLGNYVIPNYGISLAVIIYRQLLVLSGWLLGLYGIVIALVGIDIHLSSIRSFGIPFLAPVAPKRPHNPDILLRYPVQKQKRLMFFAKPDSWLRDKESETV